MAGLLEIVQQALGELFESGFDQVNGARLGLEASKLAGRSGISFKDELKQQNVSLLELVTKLAEHSPDYQLHVRLGTDFLVTRASNLVSNDEVLQRSSVQAQRSRSTIRKDFYDAFNRIRNTVLYYDAEDDRIMDEDDQTRTFVEIPPVSLQQLLDIRSSFATTVDDPNTAAELQEALRKTMPLRVFSASITRSGLGRRWHDFRYETLVAFIEGWAAEAKLTSRPEWYSSFPAPRQADPRETLSLLARYMTDNEVRDIRIPLRVVEAMRILK
jgi:hypothetical protein